MIIGCYVAKPSVSLPGQDQRSLWLKKGTSLKKGDFIGRGYWGTLTTRKPRNSDMTFRTGVDVNVKGEECALLLTADPRCALGCINDGSYGPYKEADKGANVAFVGGDDKKLLDDGTKCCFVFDLNILVYRGRQLSACPSDV